MARGRCGRGPMSPSLSSASTTISRRWNGLSSVHSTAYGGPDVTVPSRMPSTENRTAVTDRPDGARTCPTMRTAPGSPMRPSGEVILTESAEKDCDWIATQDSRNASAHGSTRRDRRSRLAARVRLPRLPSRLHQHGPDDAYAPGEPSPARAPGDRRSTGGGSDAGRRRHATACQAYSVGVSRSSTK